MESISLENLPFLASLCWQGEMPSIADRSELEILHIYERNWPLLGVMADMSDSEVIFVRQLATQYHSWLINERQLT
jgi:hypothetical protein